MFFHFFCISKHLRKNQQIRVPTVRLIGEEDEQLGIKSFDEAFQLAQDAELDLVEVAPKADPPVCKLLDYGKYLYRQSKVEQKQKRMQKQGEMKGIRLSFRIDKHDLETKIRTARKFLEDRSSVKVSLVFRGREATHGDIAKSKLDFFVDSLKDVSHIEQEPKKQGHSMFVVLTPLK